MIGQYTNFCVPKIFYLRDGVLTRRKYSFWFQEIFGGEAGSSHDPVHVAINFINRKTCVLPRTSLNDRQLTVILGNKLALKGQPPFETPKSQIEIRRIRLDARVKEEQ